MDNMVKKLQVNEMQDSEEIKSMKYLVGPIKHFNEHEFKIYRCSHLCMTKANKVDGKATSSPSQKAGIEPCLCIKKKATAMKAAAKASAMSPQNGRGSRGLSAQSSDGMDVFAKMACEQCLFVPLDSLPEPLFQQTYSKWKASLDLNFQLRKMRKKRVIYIQPIDDFPDFVTEFDYGGSKPGFFNLLQEFARTFFQGFEVRILSPIHLEETDWNVSMRSHHITQKKQYMASDIYKNLNKVLPRDGYCILGISWTDLYPSEDLNFVLGEASQEHRAGAFCFGRYEPKAYKDGQAPPKLEKIDGEILWRMLKVLSHETCHILGVQHCVFFHCAMEESTSMEEALSQPLFLCPVCLRKIQKVCQFDIMHRYLSLQKLLETLYETFPSEHMARAIRWLGRCISFLESPDVEAV